eukprot:gene1631-biopygen1892
MATRPLLVATLGAIVGAPPPHWAWTAMGSNAAARLAT